MSTQETKTGGIHLRKEDFTGIKYCVLIENTTTRTEIKDSTKIKLTEFEDNGLVLKLPKKSCAPGHALMIHIFLGKNAVKMEEMRRPEKAKKLKFFTITSKVMQVSEADMLNDVVEVQLVQFDGKEWQKFFNMFAVEQDRLDKIIQSIRE